MPKKAEVVERLNWVTERIAAWTISVGAIAVSLASIVERASAAATPFLSRRQVAIPAGRAALRRPATSAGTWRPTGRT